MILPGAVIYWNKCKPNNARSIHSKTNVLGFVKIFWNISCLVRIICTEDNQYHIVK